MYEKLVPAGPLFKGKWSKISRFFVVFVLFEILELFEYLMSKYSIFEVQLFLLELEALLLTHPK